MKSVILLVCCSSVLFAHSVIAQVDEELKIHGYELLNLPDLAETRLSGQIIVAVIDDGFRLSHQSIKDHIWVNSNEIPDNGIDDDNNGYVDDYHGWDVADADNDVSVAHESAEVNYHGTMIASIIAQTVQKSLGEASKAHIKIMPIKALSDFALRPSMEEGYAGIEYAINNNADIICMAWNGGSLESDDARLINLAAQKDILMLASAGNANTDIIAPPAGLTSVYGIGAHDSLFVKMPRSNYGSEIDLVATGDLVRAGHPIADNAFFNAQGTSSSVALATGCAAILRLVVPKISAPEVMQAMTNTAMPIDSLNPSYKAQLGAGRLNVADAMDYLFFPEDQLKYFLPYRTRGMFTLSGKELPARRELIQADGIESISLTFQTTNELSKGCKVLLYSTDSVQRQVTVENMSTQLTVPGNYCRISLTDCRNKDAVEVHYKANPIDSSTMYCVEKSVLNDSVGVITDGSGTFDYANNVSCKWLLTTTNGKRIKLDFNDFSTQSNVDQIWIFHGDKALQENLVAKFSGRSLPPLIVASTHQVLIWFLTDASVTDSGWKLRYSTTDDQAGVYERSD